MKNNKNVLKTFIIGSIVFVGLIIILSSGNNNVHVSTRNNSILNIENIFSFNKKKIDLDKLEPHLSIEIIDDGYDIYVPGRNGYRYGPSIMKYNDGTMSVWLASNGNNSTEWDYITYMHYDGQDWFDEHIVLKPTRGSRDHYSTCDPGVIYFDGYYYLGYTSTENAAHGGVENCGYVARSSNPDGPFEKWNGAGWGGNPQPIFIYDEFDEGWGAGEISFVVVDDKLYCYYTWISKDETSTKLAIATLEENWPATLQDKDVAIKRTGSQGSVDVVYVDEYNKFLALCIDGNFASNSCIAIYESDDGLLFKEIDKVKGINKFAHNMGVSKSPSGHVSMNDNLLIGYAYSKGNINIWGKWATKLQGIKFKLIGK